MLMQPTTFLTVGVLPMTTNSSGLIPVEFFVVVELPPRETKIGNIIVPDSVLDADKLATQEGTLVAISPLAFNYDNWPEGSRKPAVGDKVLFRRFAGALHERGGRDYRLLNDKDIIAIIESPAAELKEVA